MAQRAVIERAPRAGARSTKAADEGRGGASAMERGEVAQPPLVASTETGATRTEETGRRATFESYVVGAGNVFAYAAAQEILRAPGAAYNPLFIYGGAGLGKTHLLHALEAAAEAAGRSTAYVNAGDFAEEVVAAQERSALEALRARYRSVDLLLVDDTQAITGGEVVEEELLHTFTALHEAGRQIVLSSDRAPRAIRQIHARLRSRFEWGLMVDLHAPDFAHRVEILRAKAAAQGQPLAEGELSALARPEYESVRALEGALRRVVATARLLGRTVDGDLIHETLRDLAMGSTLRGLSSSVVLDAVGRHYHMTPEAICGTTREHTVALARQVAMYLLRTETEATFGAIGRLLGGRDHTTVMHGCERIGGAMVKDARLRAEVAAIRAELGQ